MKISLLQMNSVADVDGNIRQMTELADKAVALEKPDMLVTPEVWNWYGGSKADKFANADDKRGGRSYSAAQALASPEDGFAEPSEPSSILLGRLNRLYGIPG